MEKLAARVAEVLPRSVKNVIAKPLRRAASTFVSAEDLKQLGMRHATTKYYHGYLPHYQRHFADRRLEVKNVLEIGIGGYKTPTLGGDSLRMWADYFPNAHIHGIDIFDKTPQNAERITTHLGGQDDPAFLHKLIDEIGAPDIIIDDGSHMNPHIIVSFNTLFPLLADGGVYAIEDMHTAYLPGYDGDFRDLNNPGISTGFVKSLVDCVNYKAVPGREGMALDGSIVSMSVYPKLCFIEKGVNDFYQSTGEQDSVKEAAAAASV